MVDSSHHHQPILSATASGLQLYPQPPAFHDVHCLHVITSHFSNILKHESPTNTCNGCLGKNCCSCNAHWTDLIMTLMLWTHNDTDGIQMCIGPDVVNSSRPRCTIMVWYAEMNPILALQLRFETKITPIEHTIRYVLPKLHGSCWTCSAHNIIIQQGMVAAARRLHGGCNQNALMISAHIPLHILQTGRTMRGWFFVVLPL